MDFTLPRIEDTDSKSKDYVSQLERGIIVAMQVRKTVEIDASLRTKRMIEDFIGRIKEIPGIIVEKRLNKEMEVSFGEGSYEQSFEIYDIATHNEAEERSYEDAKRDAKRSLEGITNDTEDKLIRIERVEMDFCGAIGSLTEYKPLVEIDLTRPNVHFYVTRPKENKVYEAHVILNDNKLPELSISPRLMPCNFEDPNVLERFKEGAKGTDVNAYLVTNPSVLIPARAMYINAVAKYISETEDFLKKKTSDPAEVMLEGLKRDSKI